ncbi:hypothetical protein B4135_3359 [Caldibacillus debilis]|uniref:Uncharacterized protein n=1 Tax=Caldibacillus debilis TaxID=301148 RepID=A0A150LG51_9BACI|nr:hypothetical protein B4135_3359 [Caldibacillus debilis]
MYLILQLTYRKDYKTVIFIESYFLYLKNNIQYTRGAR